MPDELTVTLSKVYCLVTDLRHWIDHFTAISLPQSSLRGTKGMPHFITSLSSYFLSFLFMIFSVILTGKSSRPFYIQTFYKGREQVVNVHKNVLKAGVATFMLIFPFAHFGTFHLSPGELPVRASCKKNILSSPSTAPFLLLVHTGMVHM